MNNELPTNTPEVTEEAVISDAPEEEENTNTPKWQKSVESFVKKYPIAERYAEEVAGEISKSREEITDISLERALLAVLTKKSYTVEEMASDKQVIDKVLSDKDNRNKIIEDYIEGIRKNTPPTTLPKGGAMPMTAPQRPLTIKDAGELAKKMLTD